jgi:hypothetical protein
MAPKKGGAVPVKAAPPKAKTWTRKEPRPYNLHIRISHSTLTRLLELAGEHQMSQADVIEQLVKEA